MGIRISPSLVINKECVRVSCVAVRPLATISALMHFFLTLQAFLTRVAKLQQGALELLRSGVVVRLAQCQVYDMRPEMDPHG